ncbi:MAG: hypothetical protein BEN19_06760 [Epulopiscium sp. Nuni2H_MBin003]|nr:MAG: hypothetical protein BEN19_06760 [Epulopiscium sp. Nuni2H_MBin003]
MKFFDFDGPLYKIGNEVADFMILSLLWIILCCPIFTIGASTSAMFFIYGKKVRNEHAYILADFIKSFKENFKQSIPITIILLFMWSSIFLYFNMQLNSSELANSIYLYIIIFFLCEVIAFTSYVLAILSRFRMDIKQIFYIAILLTHRHVLTSIIIILTNILLVISVLMIPPLIMFMPAIVFYINSYLLQKAFARSINIEENNINGEEN